MFIKCILLLCFLCVLDAQIRNCNTLRIANGKVRTRSRFRVVKFSCYSHFELIGNRYSSCKNGVWESPLPVCVRPGCRKPSLKNGLIMPSNGDAWLVFFCLPGYTLVGSHVAYCDGAKWNTSAPECIDNSAPVATSCDFESPDLCGWSQDTIHDFDWTRLNMKTPSSFMMTGPSFDHTYGNGGSGYYMYVESTAQTKNDKARLLSPIYDASLAQNSCFAFYYHMFGRSAGGLRVYQKPDSLNLQTLVLMSSTEMQKYLLFEKWGNQGDFWFGNVAPLKNISEDFQIVIEGIQGGTVISGIAIDDVAILHGDKCVQIEKQFSTPPPENSCENRCGPGSVDKVYSTPHPCGCDLNCIMDNTCCFDYFDMCIFNHDASTIADENMPNNSTPALPQTQKLVATITTTPSTTSTATTTAKSTTTTPKPTTAPKPTTRISKTIITSPKPTTTAQKPTAVVKATSKPPKTTKATIFQKDEIAIPKSGETVIKLNTTKIKIGDRVPPVVKPKISKTNVTKTVVNVTVTTVTLTAATSKANLTTPVPVTTKIRKTVLIKDKSKIKMKLYEQAASEKPASSAWKPVLITITVLLAGAAVAWAVAAVRSARGRAALDYLRGRSRGLQEVRYLTAEDDAVHY